MKITRNYEWTFDNGHFVMCVLREAHREGLTAPEVARLINRNANYFANLKVSPHPPGISIVFVLCNLFDLDPREFVMLTKESNHTAITP